LQIKFLKAGIRKSDPRRREASGESGEIKRRKAFFCRLE